MKTVKTTTKLMLTLFLGLVMSYQLKATDTKIDPEKVNAKAESIVIAKAVAEVELDSEIEAVENDLMNEGIFECTEMQLIIIIGEDDEIVFRGAADFFGEGTKDLKSWTSKADFLTTIGNTSYYKVF